MSRNIPKEKRELNVFVSVMKTGEKIRKLLNFRFIYTNNIENS